MIKRLVVSFTFFCLSSYGDSLKKLYTLDNFKELSDTIIEVSPKAKSATVCIDLGGGSSGSGVIISPDGLILSAAHVTQSVGQEFEVIFEDGTRYPAIGLGLNTTSDASMAKIVASDEHPEFPYVPLSTDIEIAQYVFSLGHSGGFDKERGIVLRIGRITDISSSSMVTDCTLIGGDSGGPLFDLSGNLIGIHSRVGQITSSNTHVPIEDFESRWDDLKAGKVWGDSTFANAGLLFQGMRLMTQEEKVTVVDVNTGSNAEKAGVIIGDIIEKVAKTSVDSLQEVLEVISKKETFEKAKNGLSIEISREGTIKTLTLSIDDE